MLKIGSRVKLKPSFAKWHLDHPEIYFHGAGECCKVYDAETQLHLMCCMGVPIIGVVDGYGAYECFHVTWKCARVSASYYVEKCHVEVL